MSKKTKRQTRKTPVVAPTVPAAYAPAQSNNGSTVVRTARSSDREFKPDYTYVVKDLRRIGTLAGSFFVILVILSFFLR